MPESDARSVTVEEGAGKRCSVLLWRKVPETDAWSVWLWRKVPESDARSVTVEEGAGKRCSGCDCGGRCRKAMLGV